ncbi:MAG TPA: isochorismatase family protein [Thermoanaerobaculaceae bacterium]|nr:isochorismatase family protein [Thermoanaerobaculaceae bacterium]
MSRIVKVVSLVVVLASLAAVATAAEKPAPPRMKPALVVMDVQNAFLPYMDEQDKKTGLETMNYVIALFRDNGFPVIRVYHTDPSEGPAPGTDAFEFPKTVAVKDDDPKVVKNFPDAFKKTDLDKVLHEKGVNTVFLAGLSGVGCVLATYFGAEDRDYQVFMVKHALISHDRALTKTVYDICQNINYGSLKLLLETARAQ